ncbi:hypothetical protein AK88_03777 [Plasmodium fragile]|uniref:Uncharacterized protein n=1 Tax=Plasmodium fragile TaxID=5857 RepID=A0A0D9QLK1_PLAFR|nr:uncharacterized protein AK88_03777 [Plasmodium fragile]KJP86581.1 hypothetical protein AK88_03777 [Plasmodium fragile]
MRSFMHVALYMLVLNFCICLIRANEEQDNPNVPVDVTPQNSNLRHSSKGTNNLGKKKAGKITTQDSISKKGSADNSKIKKFKKIYYSIPDFNNKDISSIDKGHQSLPNQGTKVTPQKVINKKEKWGKKSSDGQTNPKWKTQVYDNNRWTGKRNKVVEQGGKSNKNEKSTQQASTIQEKGVTMPIGGEQIHETGELHVPNAEQGVAQVDVNGPNEGGTSDKSINYGKNESENSNPQVTHQHALPTEMPIQKGEGTTQWNTKGIDAPGYSNGVEPVEGSKTPITTSGLESELDPSHISEGDPKREQVEGGKSGDMKNETSKEEKKSPSGIEEEEEEEEVEIEEKGVNQDGNKKDGSSKKDIAQLFRERMGIASLVENIKSNDKLQKMSDDLVKFAVKAYDGFLVFIEQMKTFANNFMQIFHNL